MQFNDCCKSVSTAGHLVRESIDAKPDLLTPMASVGCCRSLWSCQQRGNLLVPHRAGPAGCTAPNSELADALARVVALLVYISVDWWCWKADVVGQCQPGFKSQVHLPTHLLHGTAGMFAPAWHCMLHVELQAWLEPHCTGYCGGASIDTVRVPCRKARWCAAATSALPDVR